jgi:hypothetical protein
MGWRLIATEIFGPGTVQPALAGYGESPERARIVPATTPINCEEVFRIQPMRNGTALGADISTVPTANQPTQGVGRSANTFPHTAAGGNPQDLVANGIAFNHQGDMFVIDSARGALWKSRIRSERKSQEPGRL